MIAAEADRVAHLGGWRSDRLSLGHPAGGLRLLAELGFDRRSQTTPQRRLLLRGEDLFVLEPVMGPELVPPLRVRRFDPRGREVGREEGAGEEGRADLVFRADPIEPGRLRLRRFGIDPGSGKPTAWEGELSYRMRGRPRPFTGTPLEAGGAWWYPLRDEAWVSVKGNGVATRPGEPAACPALVHGWPVCAGVVRGRTGIWVAGRWYSLGGPRLFPRGAGYQPQGRIAAAWGEGGVAVLLPRGGRLPVLDGPPAHLESGRYSDLADLKAGLFAVAEEDPPRLVPVGL